MSGSQKRHDSVKSWGAQRTGSGQRELTDLEPASGEHTKATQNALNGYYSTDEPSLNSFVFGASATTTTGLQVTGKNGKSGTYRVDSNSSKRTLSAFERHRPRTPRMRNRVHADRLVEEELMFEEENDVASESSLLYKVRRALSLPSNHRRYAFRSASPPVSISVSGAGSLSQPNSAKQRSLPRVMHSSKRAISSPFISAAGTANSSGTANDNGYSNGIGNGNRKSATVSDAAITEIEKKVMRIELELKKEKDITNFLTKQKSDLEQELHDKSAAIPAIQDLLKISLTHLQDKEGVLEKKLNEAIDNQLKLRR